MKKAIYAFSADPITLGHIEILERAIKLLPSRRVTVIVAINRDKNHMFSIDERMSIVETSLKHLGDQIDIIKYEGIISEYANKNNADVMIRGIRNSQDLDYEFNLEQFTRNTSNMETIYLSPFTEHLNTSSSLVRMFLKSDNIDKAEQFMSTDGFNTMKKIMIKQNENNK